MLFVTLTVLYAVSLTLITHPPLRSTKVHLLGGGADTAFLKLLKWSRYWRMVSEGVYTVSGLCLRTGGGVSAEFPTMLCSSSFIMFQHSFKITHGQYSTWINIGQFVISMNILKFEKNYLSIFWGGKIYVCNLQWFSQILKPRMFFFNLKHILLKSFIINFFFILF